MLRFLFKYLALPLFIVVVLGVAGLLGYRHFQREDIAERRLISSPTGVDTLQVVKLGGINQWIEIRGQDRSNPVLLFLHGGPGSAWIPMTHLYQDPWERYFTVVQWDQRGAGKSYRGPAFAEGLTFDRMVADAEELIGYLQRTLGKDRIVLLGHSWGSIMGTFLVKAHPEWFSAYIGVGQVVDMEQNEIVSYDWVLREARARQDKEAMDALREIGRPPYQSEGLAESILTERRYLLKFGGAHHTNDYTEFIKGLLLSPEYSLREAINYVSANTYSLEALIGEQMQVDLRRLGPRYDVPVFFFLGRNDWQTPSTLAADYFQEIDAPHKELVWFERSAHSPMLAEPQEFLVELVDRVRPYATGERTAVRISEPEPVPADSLGEPASEYEDE